MRAGELLVDDCEGRGFRAPPPPLCERPFCATSLSDVYERERRYGIRSGASDCFCGPLPFVSPPRSRIDNLRASAVF